MQLAITKNKALFDLITPAGISLIAVRGFFASKFLSSQRLKAMAAERAKTMHSITKISFVKKKFLKKVKSDSEELKNSNGNSPIGIAGF